VTIVKTATAQHGIELFSFVLERLARAKLMDGPGPRLNSNGCL
jgi:hypothetical protein